MKWLKFCSLENHKCFRNDKEKKEFCKTQVLHVKLLLGEDRTSLEPSSEKGHK